jgi:ferredoxin
MDPVIVVVYLAVVLVVFAMSMIWGGRAFCKYLCWMGPFMITGDRIRHWLKIPGLYIAPKKENCIECGKCTKGCPMDIDVQSMVQKNDMYNSECIMCLNCADTCPKGALAIKKGKP